VAVEMKKMELEGKVMKIDGLEKIYDNGFQAVKGINVKMY
jgi:hypothetical protein